MAIQSLKGRRSTRARRHSPEGAQSCRGLKKSPPDAVDFHQRLVLALAAFVAMSCTSTVADEHLVCVYTPRQSPENPYPEMQPFENCAVREGADLRIEPEHLEAMDFDEEGLTRIIIDSQFYLLRQDGTKMPVLAWEEFSEGLVRSIVDGKIAYIDKSFKVVLAPKYDFAWPFEDGVALVCNGCRAEEVAGGEHTELVGGLWGFIDQGGNEVVPLRHPRHHEASDALAETKRDRSP